MSHDVNPNLAVDLSKAKGSEVTDLSREAMAERARHARLVKAAGKARAMARAFRGISGGHGRVGYVRRALSSLEDSD